MVDFHHDSILIFLIPQMMPRSGRLLIENVMLAGCGLILLLYNTKNPNVRQGKRFGETVKGKPYIGWGQFNRLFVHSTFGPLLIMIIITLKVLHSSFLKHNKPTIGNELMEEKHGSTKFTYDDLVSFAVSLIVWLRNHILWVDFHLSNKWHTTNGIQVNRFAECEINCVSFEQLLDRNLSWSLIV